MKRYEKYSIGSDSIVKESSFNWDDDLDEDLDNDSNDAEYANNEDN